MPATLCSPLPRGHAPPGGSVVNNPAASAGDEGPTAGWGRSPGEGNGYTLQDSRLGNPRDRGARGQSVGQQESDTTEHRTWGSCLPTTPEVMQVCPFALGQGCSSQGQDDRPDIPVLNGLREQQRVSVCPHPGRVLSHRWAVLRRTSAKLQVKAQGHAFVNSFIRTRDMY